MALSERLRKEDSIMKVKIFGNLAYYTDQDGLAIDGFKELEDKINAFIKDKQVIDIKYQCSKQNDTASCSAMVMYR